MKEKIHMLHGAIGHYMDWLDLKNDLASFGVETEAYDLYQYLMRPGVGYQSFSHSLNDEIKRDETQNYNDCLLGYSLGGRLALHCLLENPDCWSKAVIVSAHTGLCDDDDINRRQRQLSDEKWALLAEDDKESWSDFLDRWNSQGVLKTDALNKMNWVDRANLEEYRSEIAHSFRVWSLAQQSDLLPRLKELTMPILWVVGENDSKFVEIAQKAMRVLPNAHLHIMKDTGHRVPWEKAPEFTQLVSEWLAQTK